jgi:hypothetical protein
MAKVSVTAPEADESARIGPVPSHTSVTDSTEDRAIGKP